MTCRLPPSRISLHAQRVASCLCGCACVVCLPCVAVAQDDADDDVYEIIVHADDPDVEDMHARTTLDATDIERAANDDLAHTVATVPGVRTAGGTSDVAKPIIRGQQERRLLVLNDGVRHESQKWGADHATEIDPFSAGSIGVVRGAAGARYGPDAIGGVILVEPPPLSHEVGVHGTAVGAFATNGLRPFAGVRMDDVPAAAPNLTVRLQASGAAGAARTSPNYVLGNTASRTYNLGGTVGYRFSGGQLRASWHHHDLRAGIFYGVQNSTPTDFYTQLDADKPATADLWVVTHAIDRAYQDVTHDTGTLRADLYGDWGTLEVIYAFQVNRRREFAQVRENVTGAQYDFTLRTHSLDALYRHPTLTLPFGTLEGGMGLQGGFQENVYRGYALLPNYRAFSGGLFGFERLSLPRVDLQVGARLDGLARTAFMSPDDYARHISRHTLDANACTDNGVNARCPAAYHTGSVSIGGLAHVVPQLVDVKLDLSTASRFPNVDELYLIGTAPSYPVYALGSPDLGVETAWGATVTGGLRHTAIEAELSGFAQHVDNYINFAPDLDDTGTPRFDVTIRGTWPRFTFTAVDATVTGLDGAVSLVPEAPVGLDLRGGLVRVRDSNTGAHVTGTPADHLNVALVGRPPSLGPLHDTRVYASAEFVAKQSRVDPTLDFAPPPDAYALVGLGVETTIGSANPVRVGLDVRNLLDARYREYTSLLRYYADQPGRDVRLRVGVDF